MDSLTSLCDSIETSEASNSSVTVHQHRTRNGCRPSQISHFRGGSPLFNEITPDAAEVAHKPTQPQHIIPIPRPKGNQKRLKGTRVQRLRPLKEKRQQAQTLGNGTSSKIPATPLRRIIDPSRNASWGAHWLRDVRRIFLPTCSCDEREEFRVARSVKKALVKDLRIQLSGRPNYESLGVSSKMSTRAMLRSLIALNAIDYDGKQFDQLRKEMAHRNTRHSRPEAEHDFCKKVDCPYNNFKKERYTYQEAKNRIRSVSARLKEIRTERERLQSNNILSSTPRLQVRRPTRCRIHPFFLTRLEKNQNSRP